MNVQRARSFNSLAHIIRIHGCVCVCVYAAASSVQQRTRAVAVLVPRLLLDMLSTNNALVDPAAPLADTVAVAAVAVAATAASRATESKIIIGAPLRGPAKSLGHVGLSIHSLFFFFFVCVVARRVYTGLYIFYGTG